MSGASGRILSWTLALLLAAAAGVAGVELRRSLLESSYQDGLATEAARRAVEIGAATLNGNVMGSVAALGLFNQPAKQSARAEVAAEDAQLMEALRAVGESYQANGVYVVNSLGVVQSCWYTMGRTLTGVDVKFRPYFQIALQGQQNVYAAIGTTTGQRALYFAAPLYDQVSSNSPLIGVAVARLNPERIDAALRAWSGPALLLSPQDVTFASNREEWIEQLAWQKNAEELKAISALKQFGHSFEGGTPKILPFDIRAETVVVDQRRYAVARAKVRWNDPNGEWNLVLLGDLDALLPPAERASIGLGSAALVLALAAVFLAWRRRLADADVQRRRAQAELTAYTGRLESDSANKSYLAEVSAELHQAGSLAEFTTSFMRLVAPRVGADYAALYWLDQDSGRLLPVGGHGVRAADLEAVEVGQGLIGQCAKDRLPIELADPTGNEIRIVWGEGSLAPRFLLLLPLAQPGRLLGVLLLAALRPPASEQRALLETMLPMVTTNLEILNRNLATESQAQALRAQEQKLGEMVALQQAIFDNIPAGVFLTADGLIHQVNRGLAEMLGGSEGDLVGKPASSIFPSPEVYAEFGVRAGPLLAQGKPIADELQFIRGDGRACVCRVSGRPVAISGHSRCAIWLLEDITEAKAAEQKLRESEAKVRRIFETANEGIWLIDLDIKTTDANGAMCAILGRDLQEVVGRPIFDFVDADNQAIFREQIRRRKEGETGAYEVALRRPDGGNVPCLFNATPLLDTQGKRIGSFAMVTDISERKQSEEATRFARELAEDATKMKSDFLANLRQEIRTPMNAIIGMAQLALQGEVTPQQRDCIGQIQSASQQLLGIINDILDASEIAVGKPTVEPSRPPPAAVNATPS